MASKEMAYFNVGNNEFEIVDEAGRQATSAVDEKVDGLTADDISYSSTQSTKQAIDSLVPQVVLSIPANTYSTYALALAALEAAFDGLTETEKLRCKIRRNDSVIVNLENLTSKSFSGCASTASSFIVQEVILSTHNFYYMGYTTSPGYTDFTNLAQSQRLELIIV